MAVIEHRIGDKTDGKSGFRPLSSSEARLRPTFAILHDFLENPTVRAGLLSRNPAIRQNAEDRISHLGSGGLQLQLIGDLLGVIATKQDPRMRSGATELLRLRCTDGVTPYDILSTYLASVPTVVENNIPSLLRAGIELAPDFTDESFAADARETLDMRRGSIAQTWMAVAQRIEDQDSTRHTIALGVFDIQHRLSVDRVGDPAVSILARRRRVLEVWEPGLSAEELESRLVNQRNSSGRRRLGYPQNTLEEDLAYLTACGIDVPLVPASSATLEKATIT